MRKRVTSWILWAAAMTAALGAAWALRGSALYRGYVAGRTTGAVLFTIVQTAVEAEDAPQGKPVCSPGHGAGRL